MPPGKSPDSYFKRIIVAPVLRVDCRGFQGRTGGCSQEAAAVAQGERRWGLVRVVAVGVGGGATFEIRPISGTIRFADSAPHCVRL